MKIAIIDLGTNTFHMVIYQTMVASGSYQEIGRKCLDVRLGEKGLSADRIMPEATQRALEAMETFRDMIWQEQVDSVYAIGTSALRNATNGPELVKQIQQQTGISVSTITGEQEAMLIYRGVKEAIKLHREPVLIMDIGGGSVEFIICNDQAALWQRSFEIGAQRLVDQFHQQDPIPQAAITEMSHYLSHQLQPLFEAVVLHCPTRLVGSSGAFATLINIYAETEHQTLNPLATAYEFPIEEFKKIYKALLHSSHQDRLQTPGLSNQRVDMIVVSSFLIAFVIEKLAIQHLTTSKYALKEGLLVYALQAIQEGRAEESLF